MYSIIDIEGNGAGYQEESIIEVAIYKYNGQEIVDQFISLVNPEAPITSYVQKLTGITSKMVKTAPKFHELARRILEITEGTTLVGHNIPFDYRMLRQSFQRLGYRFKINTLDTLPLSKKLIPEAESYALGNLVKSLGIPLTNAHRAAGDARATLELFKILITKDIGGDIIQSQFAQTNAKTYLNKVKELTEDLPNHKGILYFQDKNGKILHQDFVNNINKYANKLFNSIHQRWESIQKNTEQISFELAGHDIIAKLLMLTKGIQKEEKRPYSLIEEKNNYIIIKTELLKTLKPLLQFRSLTQGKKVLQTIKSNEEFKDVAHLIAFLTLENRNEIWSCDSGRKLGENFFLILENGRVTLYGFYEYYTQIESLSQVNQLKISVNVPEGFLDDDLKLSLLKKEFDTYPYPPELGNNT